MGPLPHRSPALGDSLAGACPRAFPGSTRTRLLGNAASHTWPRPGSSRGFRQTPSDFLGSVSSKSKGDHIRSLQTRPFRDPLAGRSRWLWGSGKALVPPSIPRLPSRTQVVETNGKLTLTCSLTPCEPHPLLPRNFLAPKQHKECSTFFVEIKGFSLWRFTQ